MIGWRDVLSAVASYYRCSQESLRGPRRWEGVSHRRAVAIYVIRQLCRMSTPEIGLVFHRHHTTILNALARVQADPEMLFDAQAIARAIADGKFEEEKFDADLPGGAPSRRHSH